MRRWRMTNLVVIIGVLVFWGLSVAVAQVTDPPLPANLKIIPPGAGVSPRLAQLSGIWEGSWNYEAPPGGGLRKLFPMDMMGRGVRIAIVEITPPKVEAIYSLGGSPDRPGRWFGVRDASVSGDSIILKWGKPGRKKTVTLRPSGNPGVAHGTLQTETVAHVLKASLRKKEYRTPLKGN